MQKIIHKLIRFNRGGVNVVADINAAISSGEGGVARSSVRSYRRIVQRNGQTQTTYDSDQADQSDQPDEKEVFKNGEAKT